jgi:hypothetical protein
MSIAIISLTPEEREIIINKTAADEGFEIYVSDPVWLSRLTRLGWNPCRSDKYGASFEVPVEAVTIRSKAAVDHPRRGNPGALAKARLARAAKSAATATVVPLAPNTAASPTVSPATDVPTKDDAPDRVPSGGRTL